MRQHYRCGLAVWGAWTERERHEKQRDQGFRKTIGYCILMREENNGHWLKGIGIMKVLFGSSECSWSHPRIVFIVASPKVNGEERGRRARTLLLIGCYVAGGWFLHYAGMGGLQNECTSDPW